MHGFLMDGHKCAFSIKGRQSLHVMRIRKMLIYCIILDHVLYLTNCSSKITFVHQSACAYELEMTRSH